jgi:outer membrane protein TolC
MRSLIRLINGRSLLCGVLLSVPVICATARQDPVTLTLAEAIDLALKNNHALLIGAHKVAEMTSAKHVAASDYYPKISNSSSYLHFTDTNILQFSTGSFGTFPVWGPLPSTTLIVPQGNLDQVFSHSQVAQPISQLIKIRHAQRAARADEMAAREDLESLRNQIALAVRQLYYGLLAVQLDQKTASEEIHVAEEQLSESEQDVRRGNELEVTLLGAKTALLQAKQDELTARMRNSDLMTQFKEVIGLPNSVQIQLDEQVFGTADLPGQEECIRLAQSAAPEIKSAEETVRRAQAGVAAAKAEYIPDITAFGRWDYQNGVAFLFHNYGVVGIGLNYTLFDGGKKKALVSERAAQRDQAIENLRRLKDEAAVNVQKAFDKINQSRSLVDVAKQAVALRDEGDRLARVQTGYGVLVSSKRSEAVAAASKARADLLKAQLGYLESQAQLAVLIGRLPR